MTYVSRYNPNGTLDNTFGSSGKTAVDFCTSLKVDGSDRILAGGSLVQSTPRKSSYNDFAVKRLLANGATDTGFGSAGTTVIDFAGFNETLWKVEVQADGRVVLIGESNSTATNKGAGIARLNSNGSLDLTFGQNGRAFTDFSPANEYARDGMMQIDPVCGCEKIVIVGTVDVSGIDYAIAARYLP